MHSNEDSSTDLKLAVAVFLLCLIISFMQENQDVIQTTTATLP